MVKISLPTLILQWINFLILLFVLKKLLYKPLLDFLDKRTREVENNIEESKRLQEEASKLLERQHDKLMQAKQEALEIVRKAKQYAGSESERIVEEAKKKAFVIIENTRKQIEAEIQRQKQILMQEIGSISVKLTEKIIERELQTKDIDRLTKNFIKELETSSRL